MPYRWVKFIEFTLKSYKSFYNKVVCQNFLIRKLIVLVLLLGKNFFFFLINKSAFKVNLISKWTFSSTWVLCCWYIYENFFGHKMMVQNDHIIYAPWKHKEINLFLSRKKHDLSIWQKTSFHAICVYDFFVYFFFIKRYFIWWEKLIFAELFCRKAAFIGIFMFYLSILRLNS